MGTYRLRLASVQADPQKYGASTHIALKTYGQVNIGKDDATVISLQIMSIAELNHEINGLIKELETLRKEGYKLFEK